MRAAIPVVLFLLAGWLWTEPFTPRLDPAPTPAFDRAVLGPVIPRPLREQPTILVLGGVEQRCNDCHDVFDSDVFVERPLRQHEHVVLDHGLNDRCYNCHHYEDRELLVLHDGRGVPFEQSALLCGKCHGPTYRDWERGVHGRTDGYWSQAHGEARRLTCIECHDPHAPAFPALEALPGPHAWRAPSEAPPTPDLDPLESWLGRGGHGGGHGGSASDDGAER